MTMEMIYRAGLVVEILVIILFLLIRLIKVKSELKAYKRYEKSYEALITDIRLKQHDFNNQINAIYSLHKTCRTYDELVYSQRNLCGDIVNDNKYYKLLRLENPMLCGFLYEKFEEADKKGIKVLYDINVKKQEFRIPMHIMVRICGNLLNNAYDAVTDSTCKKVRFVVKEEPQLISISVSNPCEYKTPQEVAEMFKFGKSTKGDNRGLGLYSVKKLSKEYGFWIMCENITVEDANWIEFTIQFKKN